MTLLAAVLRQTSGLEGGQRMGKEALQKAVPVPPPVHAAARAQFEQQLVCRRQSGLWAVTGQHTC